MPTEQYPEPAVDLTPAIGTFARLAALDPARELADRFQLLDADHVAHPGIEADGHVGAHPLQGLSGLDHTRHRDVRVDVAAAEKHRRPRERPREVARRPVGPDQAAAEADDRDYPG